MAFNMNKPVIKGTKAHSALLAKAEEAKNGEVTTASQALIEAAQQFSQPVERLDLDYGGEMDIEIPVNLPDQNVIEEEEEEQEVEEQEVEEQEVETGPSEATAEGGEGEEGGEGGETGNSGGGAGTQEKADKKSKGRAKRKEAVKRVRDWINKNLKPKPGGPKGKRKKEGTESTQPPPPPPPPQSDVDVEPRSDMTKEERDATVIEPISTIPPGGEVGGLSLITPTEPGPTSNRAPAISAKDNPKYNQNLRLEGELIMSKNAGKHESAPGTTFNEGFTYNHESDQWYYANESGTVHKVGDDEVPLGYQIQLAEQQKEEYKQLQKQDREYRNLNFVQRRKYQKEHPGYIPPRKRGKSTINKEVSKQETKAVDQTTDYSNQSLNDLSEKRDEKVKNNENTTEIQTEINKRLEDKDADWSKKPENKKVVKTKKLTTREKRADYKKNKKPGESQHQYNTRKLKESRSSNKTE